MKPFGTSMGLAGLLALPLVFACGPGDPSAGQRAQVKDSLEEGTGSGLIEEGGAESKEASEPGVANADSPNTGPLPEGCAKIEGEELGETEFELVVGKTRVAITDWVSKKGERCEYVGLSFETEEGVCVEASVKAGTETFPVSGESWVHPAGVSGSAAKGISNVVFCQIECPASTLPPPPEDAPSDEEPPTID